MSVDNNVGRTIDFRSRDDLCYLEALVDSVPRVAMRADMPMGALSDDWRAILRCLIAVAKDATS